MGNLDTNLVTFILHQAWKRPTKKNLILVFIVFIYSIAASLYFEINLLSFALFPFMWKYEAANRADHVG